MRGRLTGLLAAALLAALALSGCGERAEQAAAGIVTQVVEEVKAPPEGYVPQNNGFRYAKSLLTSDQQYVYDQLVAGIEAQETEIKDLYPDTEMIFAAAKALHRDYPEFFWFNGGGKVNTTLLGDVPVSAVYLPEYTVDSATRAVYQEQIDQWTADCLGSIPVGSSDYEKVLGVYRYIIDHTDYQKVDSNSIVNVMVNGYGLCGCYAMTTQYLLNRIGVDCTYVSGMAREQTHAWNLVWLDGNPCWLDTTWGDPVFEGGNPGDGPSYDYFCITTDDLVRTHTIDDEVWVPYCLCQDYNYYRHNGRFFDYYDWNTLVGPMETAISGGEKQIAVRFTDRVYEEAKARLFTDMDISTLYSQVDQDLGTAFSRAKQFTYTCNDALGVITLIFPA